MAKRSVFIALVLLLFAASSCNGRRTSSKTDRRICMKLTEESCLALSPEYPKALSKNRDDYARKLIEFRVYNSLVEDTCHEIFHAFTCVAYFPRCSKSVKYPILPCRSLCERARAECEEKLNSTGIKWPKRLNCKKFPRSADKECVNHNEVVSTTASPHGFPWISTSESCESMIIPFCNDVGYNLTHRPQSFSQFSHGLAWQLQVQSLLQTFTPLIQSGCSPNAKLFLCSAYVPECTESQGTFLPCRSLCESVKAGCLDMLTSFGYSWPDSTGCDSFPTTNCKEPSSSIQARTTPVPIVCEPITTSLCAHIGYNFTHFPNSDFESQVDAGLEVHQFYPLIQMGCSPDLHEFLCAVYIPECTENRERIQPCRSLCESAKSGCQELMTRFSFSWPAILECSKYPDTDCKGEKSATTTPTTELTPQATPADLLQKLNETISDIAAYVETLVGPSSNPADGQSSIMVGLRSSVSGLRAHAETIGNFLRVLKEINNAE